MKREFSQFSYTLIFLFFIQCYAIGQHFEEVSQQLGINVEYGWEPLASGSVCFADFNMDGWDDLTFSTSSGDSIHFYINNQNGGFTKIPSLIDDVEKARAILWADIDNDGDRDLFVTHEGSANRMYLNNGNLQMVDITEDCGLPIFLNDNTWGACFGDYDNDGFLDLYVMNRVGQFTNYMFHNNGDATFTNTTIQTNTHDSLRLSLTGAFFDMNMDGWQDLHVSQDKIYMRNSTYKNNRNGGFIDVSDISGSDAYVEAMSAAIGDYNNDGHQDIYITNTNTLGGNVLFRNNGDETFTNVANPLGVEIFSTSWGASFFDYDNDLDQDLFVCLSDSFNKYNRLFENDGNGGFTDIYAGTSGMPNDTVPCFSSAIGDYDNDGKVDLVVHSFTPFHSRIWRNKVNNGNNYLKVNLQGTTSNRDGVGALLELYINGNKYIRYGNIGDGYVGQNSFTHHFGMGSHNNADSLVIRWLGGNVDKLYNIAANKNIKVIEGSTVSTKKPIATIEKSFNIINIAPNPILLGQSKINIHSKKYQQLDLIFFNHLGRVEFQQKIEVLPGDNKIFIPENALKSRGMFQCVVTNKEERDEATLMYLAE